MVDLATDLDNLTDMIHDSAEELRAKDPGHELVRFYDGSQHGQKMSASDKGLFSERFALPGIRVFQMWVNFYLALETALGRPPATGTDTPAQAAPDYPPIEDNTVIPF